MHWFRLGLFLFVNVYVYFIVYIIRTLHFNGIILVYILINICVCVCSTLLVYKAFFCCCVGFINIEWFGIIIIIYALDGYKEFGLIFVQFVFTYVYI